VMAAGQSWVGIGLSPMVSRRESRDAVVVSAPGWHLLASGRLAQVYAEPSLYRVGPDDTARCLVRVRITNPSSRPVGVDLSDYWNVVYPNQWTVSPEPRRLLIDEAEFAPRSLTRDERSRLRTQHRSRALVQIQAGGSEDYFRDFNARCPTGSASGSGRYLIMSMSGRLLMSDGRKEGQVSLLGMAPERRDVVISLPLAWKEVPLDARVIRHP
jgi:hypothetical protein